ncbi:MAG: TonB C-terminal domain-containing protein, partial [Desulfobacterales bacterium]|nr:TonB C-terminal domain-containing protein [Desulfobacterales bacterium]
TTGYMALKPIDIYRPQVDYYIKKNWVFSEQLAGEHIDLEVKIVIKIMANGHITDIWFEKRSGNSYLDESAYKAIKKSSPLPPLPKGHDFYHFLLGFTPKGVN